MNAKYIEVTTTVPEERQAIQLSQIIVSRKLAASVQVSGPFNGAFWWNNRLETCEEYKCSFKTSVSLYPKLQKELSYLHPYRPPEIIAFPIIDGPDEYFQWMERELDLNEENVEDARYTEDTDI